MGRKRGKKTTEKHYSSSSNTSSVAKKFRYTDVVDSNDIHIQAQRE